MGNETMTTILHVSDTHLGKRQYGSDIRRADFADAFEQAIDIACGNHPDHDNDPVDAVVHTGDLFDRRTPPLPDVRNCIRILRKLEDMEIPFLGIVGNHERKMDDQWLDLIEETRTAKRLDRTPTMVGDVALYGIDAVTKPAWESTDFTLEEPENDDSFRLLCMHQLFHPPVPEIMANHQTEDVLNRLGIGIDGLALGDYHEAESDIVNGVEVWYAGSTERNGADEREERGVWLLGVDEDGRDPDRLKLDTRKFQPVQIEFDEDDGYAHARNELESYQLNGRVVRIRLTGKRTSLSSSDIYDVAVELGAAVCTVNDDRGRQHINAETLPGGDVQDPDQLIEERLAEVGVSDAAGEVERVVRAGGVPTSNLADETEELVHERQQQTFEGVANE